MVGGFSFQDAALRAFGGATSLQKIASGKRCQAGDIGKKWGFTPFRLNNAKRASIACVFWNCVQQSATPKVRKLAFLRHLEARTKSAVIVFVYAPVMNV